MSSSFPSDPPNLKSIHPMLEKLIDVLNRIAFALEQQNAANGVAPVAAPAKKSARTKVAEKLEALKAENPDAVVPEATQERVEVAAKAPSEPTIQDLINAAQAVLAHNGNDPTPLAEINVRFGVKKLREIPSTAYAEVIAELNGMINAAANAKRA